MAFNPDAYLAKKGWGGAGAKDADTGETKGGFNPDAYLAKKGWAKPADDQDDPTKSKVTALAAGSIHGATRGWSDEASALGSTALDAITGHAGPLEGVNPGKIADYLLGNRDHVSEGSMQDLVDEYRKKRDENRSEVEKIKAANPKTFLASELVGGGLTSGGVPGSLGKAVMQGAQIGGSAGLGNSNADLTRGEYGKAAWDTAKGVGYGVGAGVVGYGAGKLVGSIADGSAAKAVKKFAGKSAEKATGATGKQLSTFEEGAGEELLDRGLVKFGDTPEKIAERTKAAMTEAEGHMDSVLKTLDDRGVTVDANNVVKGLQEKIATLRKDPSQADVVRKLSGIVDDIIETGESHPLISAAETTKRGYNGIAKNWLDPDKGKAGKAAYRAYRDEVESAATAADPSMANKFIEAKKTYGLLAPIQEAAERRAMTLQQSPIGGLKDAAAATAGMIKGGPPGALLSVVGQRLISPRLASGVAVTSNNLSKILAKTPEAFGKFAPILQNAAQRGSQALSATNALLQKDPQYLQVLNSVARSSQPSNDVAAVTTPPVLAPDQEDRKPAEQLKGEALWMQKGADKLGLSSDDLAGLTKPQRQMLIEASDLKPGSKRLQSIKNQLQGNK